MYLKRKIDAFLENWKSQSSRKPLIIKGARQIGKTEAIRHFAAEHYDHVVEIMRIAVIFTVVVDAGCFFVVVFVVVVVA